MCKDDIRNNRIIYQFASIVRKRRVTYVYFKITKFYGTGLTLDVKRVDVGYLGRCIFISAPYRHPGC